MTFDQGFQYFAINVKAWSSGPVNCLGYPRLVMKIAIWGLKVERVSKSDRHSTDFLKTKHSPNPITSSETTNSNCRESFDKFTLSVLRIFVHSVSCHFSCQKSCNSIIFVKLQHSLLDFCHLTNFFLHGLDYWFFYDFKPHFLLETGKILERSQWIQILLLNI